MTSCLGSLSTYTFAVQYGLSGVSLLLQPFHFTFSYKHPILFPSTLSFLSLHFLHPSMLPAVLHLMLPFPPLTAIGVFNGMSEVFEPETVSFSTLSRFILRTLSVSRNPASTYLPFRGSLDTLLSDLIALTPSLAFILLMTSTPAMVLSFSSTRAYPFLNFLPPLSSRLTPTLAI